MWRSPVARTLGVGEVQGSNPCIPTIHNHSCHVICLYTYELTCKLVPDCTGISFFAFTKKERNRIIALGILFFLFYNDRESQKEGCADMKIQAMFPAYTPQLTNVLESGTSSEDALFADILQAEVAGGQRVITAQQIAAELNGSPRWDFFQTTSGNYTYTAGQANIPVSTILEKIERVARSYGVDEDLVREVVRAESNFNPLATSHAGAKGLMQLMDATAQAMRVRDAYNPDENLAGGTKYLKELIDRFDGNVGVALAAYNAGPTRVSRLGIANDEQLMEKYHLLPEETQRYVEKIVNRL